MHYLSTVTVCLILVFGCKSSKYEGKNDNPPNGANANCLAGSDCVKTVATGGGTAGSAASAGNTAGTTTAGSTAGGVTDGSSGGLATGGGATSGSTSGITAGSTGVNPVTPDGIFSAIGAGDGGGPRISHFDSGFNKIQNYFGFDSNLRNGVRLAIGDLKGDKTLILATMTGPGVPTQVQFRAKDGSQTNMPPAFTVPFGPGYNLSGSIAACDVMGLGYAQLIIGAGNGGASRVSVYDVKSGSAALLDFFAFDPNRRAGVNVGCGDIDGDGVAEIFTAEGPNSAPTIRVYKKGTLIKEIPNVFAAPFNGGINLTGGDFEGNKKSSIVAGAASSGAPHVRIFSGTSFNEIANFFAYEPNAYPVEGQFRFGVVVSGVRFPGDANASLLVGASTGGGSHYRVLSNISGASYTARVNDQVFEPTFFGGLFVAGWPN